MIIVFMVHLAIMDNTWLPGIISKKKSKLEVINQKNEIKILKSNK